MLLTDSKSAMVSIDDKGKINPRKRHDELLKGAFKENFIDFLRFVYADADDLFAFDRGIVFMDKELLAIIPDRERKGGGRIADLLVKVYLRDGTERWLLVHTEIEAGSDAQFSFRIYQYHYRILDRYNMPVETIAVFTGDRNQPRPSEYVYEGIGTSNHFRYIAYHIFDHSEEDLLAMDNIFAYIVLACQKALREGKVPKEELAEDRSTIARALIASGKYDKQRVFNFILFLKNFIFIEDEVIDNNFDSLIYSVTGGIIDMGILEIVRKHKEEDILERGREEGREAEKLAIVRSLIRQSDFSDETIAGITGSAVSLVAAIRAEVAEK